MTPFQESLKKRFQQILALTLGLGLLALNAIAAASFDERPTKVLENQRASLSLPHDHDPTGARRGTERFLTVKERPTPSPTPTPTPVPTPTPSPTPTPTPVLKYPLPNLKPLGSAGSQTVHPVDPATDEFIPLPDRWRLGWPRYDRYEPKRETPYVEGGLFDPFNQNVLKGDYPIIGNHTFLNLNLQSASLLNPRAVAAGGRRDQFFTNQNLVLGAEIFKGDTVFQPKIFALRVTAVVNFNFLANNALNPFKSKPGKARIAIEEAFFEKRLAVISPNFDFISVRAGMQNFTSDFRGFLFSDNQFGVRLFGNAHSNRDQYNVAFFYMRQRDEVSQLHQILKSRRQRVFIANWFRQDFLTKGYTAMVNFHFNSDQGITPGDRARLNVAYFGFHGDGRWGRWNVDHAFYYAFGRDSSNRLSRRSERINAEMAAIEISRDWDWRRYRASFFYASGDRDLNDGKANGFDMIADNPNFAGGAFMFWNQQATALGGGFGILKNKFSLLSDLRNKFTQRSNFVNPGLLLFNAGADFRITPKLKLVTNLSYLRFARARVLQQLTGDNLINNGIGWDLSVAVKFRPFLNENVTIVFGASMLVPQGGYGRLIDSTRPLFSPIVAVQFAF